MNRLLKTSFVIIFSVMCSVAFAQKEYKFSMSSGTLRIDEINEVKIEGTSGSEVIIRTEKENTLPERAAGLKPVGASNLTDNTGIGLAVQDTENGKSIHQVIRNMDGQITVLVPSGVKLHITHSGNSGETIRINGFGGEIEADTRYSGFKLTDVTGPVMISTIYGEVEATFKSISSKQMSIASSYGLIDVALPSGTKANLQMKSGHGDIFTDFDISYEKEDGMRKVRSTEIKGQINGGGPNIHLQANYGNIFLRSK